MAVTPTTPPLTLLPDPPLTTDSEDVFNSKTDITLLAQQNMVVQINAALVWQAASMAAALDYKNAAGASASAASDSASTAATQANLATTNGAAQVVLAAAQVGLANTARQGAEAALLSAQVAAAAAQAAAGLPSFVGHDAFDVLQINAGKTGVQWGKVGQSVGDILHTTVSPGALYLPADGAIYLKSAYPLLAAAVGTIGEKNFAATFSVTPAGFGANAIYGIACGKDGVLIAVGNNILTRSTDGGANWTTVSSLSGLFRSIATDKNGVWIAGTNSAQAYRSTDNGLTWAAVIVSSGLDNGSMVSIATDRLGTWILVQDGVTGHYRSTNNGASFSAVNSGTPGMGTSVDTDGSGTWLIGTTLALGRSDDGAATWSYRQDASQVLSASQIVTDRKGNWVAGSIAGSLLVSKDKGVSWSTLGMLYTTGGVKPRICVDANGIWAVGGASGKILRSSDLLEWKLSISGLGSAVVNAIGCNDSGNFLAGGDSGVMTRSAPAYFYDTSTQFKVPKLAANGPVVPYIKSKVA